MNNNFSNYKNKEIIQTAASASFPTHSTQQAKLATVCVSLALPC